MEDSPSPLMGAETPCGRSRCTGYTIQPIVTNEVPLERDIGLEI